MFGFFKKSSSNAKDWACHMAWRVVTYQEGERWVSLEIEPMKDAPCRVYVPTESAWQASAPDWAKDKRAAILQRMKQVAWNRDLEWPESEKSLAYDLHARQPLDGSLESTQGGQTLMGMRLFDPDSPVKFSKRDAKRAWCTGAEQMCLQISGEVSPVVTRVIQGSVFQEIELPALRRNPNVKLNYSVGAG